MVAVGVMMLSQMEAALAWDSKNDLARWVLDVSALSALPVCIPAGWCFGPWSILAGVGFYSKGHSY